MTKRTIIKNGKKFIVNTPSWSGIGDDFGIGSGFPLGQMIFKSATDSFWYVVSATGVGGSVSSSVSQSALSYADNSYPYQLLYSPNDGKSYAVYLSGSAPSASLIVSQSAYTGSDTPKPYLVFQNSTDGNYYVMTLSSSTARVSMSISQTAVSSSWLHS